jgi:hypothetical protein
MDWWQSIRHKLQAAGRLSPGEWLGLAEAWWVLLGFNLALRRVSLERLERFTRPRPGKIAEVPDAVAWAWQSERVIRMAAGLHLLRMTCLHRALTLRWRLSRGGLASQLCIGVNRTATGRYAHAWVEMEGESIGESEDIAERFTTLR